MIIKLDHIAFSCSLEDVSKALISMEDYHMVFHEKDVINLGIKQKIMKNWTEKHDIILLEKDKGLPIEITAYTNTVNPIKSKYDIDRNTIIVNTTNIEQSKQFYKTIGFKEVDTTKLTLLTIMDDFPVEINLRESNKEDDYCFGLDTNGFCCIALITNHIEKEKEKLRKNQITTTEIMGLIVNHKELQIFFAMNTFGDICEFICPIDNKKGKI